MQTLRGTISGKSSSSGSYSLNGSNPNVTEDTENKAQAKKAEPPKPKEIPERKESTEEKAKSPVIEMEQLVPKMMVTIKLLKKNFFYVKDVLFNKLFLLQGSLSDDERSVHYSSSGYYESPVEDDDDGGLSMI